MLSRTTAAWAFVITLGCSSSTPHGNGFVSDASPGYKGSCEPCAGVIVEPNACAALADCCSSMENACAYYCAMTDDCADAFQYLLGWGYCSSFTYTSYVPNATLPVPDASVCAVDAGD